MIEMPWAYLLPTSHQLTKLYDLGIWGQEGYRLCFVGGIFSA